MKYLITLLLCVTYDAYAFSTPAPATPFAATGTIEYAFAPEDNVDTMIIAAIHAAHSEILVQAFSFTHRKIAQALIDAHRRGIDVTLIADREQTFGIKNSMVRDIAKAGVPVLLDDKHVNAHNKVMVIDAAPTNNNADCAVITGSFNFTYGAQFNNAENALVLRGNAGLCKAYYDNWQRHRAHSQPYGK